MAKSVYQKLHLLIKATINTKSDVGSNQLVYWREVTMGLLIIVLLFIELLQKKTTKHHMFRATDIHQSRELYSNAVGDVGDI